MYICKWTIALLSTLYTPPYIQLDKAQGLLPANTVVFSPASSQCSYHNPNKGEEDKQGQKERKGGKEAKAEPRTSCASNYIEISQTSGIG